MTNENVRLYPHDKLLDVLIVRFLPRQLHPNHITLFRFIMIPLVLWYVNEESWLIAILLFLFAAFTDALDGSLARLRKEITMWGTVADPFADKLLIGSVVVLFVAKEVNPAFAAVIVIVEMVIIMNGIIRHHRNHMIVSANWAGKLKMLSQVIGVTLLLAARLSGYQLLVPFSIGTLTVAIVFAIVSLLTYSM